LIIFVKFPDLGHIKKPNHRSEIYHMHKPRQQSRGRDCKGFIPRERVRFGNPQDHLISFSFLFLLFVLFYFVLRNMYEFCPPPFLM
jgi:hypothetical protein